MHPDFKKNGYLVARNFFDNTTVALMQTYFDLQYRLIKFNKENGIGIEKSELGPDKDVAATYCFYSDCLLESIHLYYGQKVCDIMQMSLSPTYTYARIYEKGDSLYAHRDRLACEISMSCPILISGEAPSTLFISNYKEPRESTEDRIAPQEIEKRGDYTEIDLYPGDVVFYSGCDRYHWRRPLEDDFLVQCFLHFVDPYGKNKEWVFDKRPYCGFFPSS